MDNQIDQQSLEDLLTFIELRNITLAAHQRNISQPAYSRRLRAIEEKHGIALVDRSGRPAVPTQALSAMREEIEFALTSLKRVSNSLTRNTESEETISIAAVHLLSADLLPRAISKIENSLTPLRFRIHSANQDHCFQLLMTEEVSIMLAFESLEETIKEPKDFVEKVTLSNDKLVPVCTPQLARKIRNITPGAEMVPLIAYPSDVFLGRVLYNGALVHSSHIFSKQIVAGLTNVVLSSAKNSLGIAWLPLSLLKHELNSNELIIIEDIGFPSVELTTSMLRLRTRNMRELDPLWNAMIQIISALDQSEYNETFARET